MYYSICIRYDAFRKHHLLSADEEVELAQQIEAARLAPMIQNWFEVGTMPASVWSNRTCDWP